MNERDKRLAEIRERHAASTPGTWYVGPGYNEDIAEIWVETDHEGGWPICGFDESGRSNLEFIAEAHQDIPWLLAEVERLKQRVKALDAEVERRIDYDIEMTGGIGA